MSEPSNKSSLAASLLAGWWRHSEARTISVHRLLAIPIGGPDYRRTLCGQVWSAENMEEPVPGISKFCGRCAKILPRWEKPTSV